jgi:pyridoxamine 5'-phosphate oxidase
MNAPEILDFIRANPACHLATVEGDQPRVRGMFLYRVDDLGIIFHTGTAKPLWEQLQVNPKVEVCFLDPKCRLQVRLEGLAETLSDPVLTEEIVQERPFLKPIVAAFGLSSIGVFRVKPLRAAEWSMGTNLAPTEWVAMV